ncbi:hypothetical protein [Streptomyces sp. NPDC017520]|uniref:hypothetical protein n=1 Tax=Streptomyces sp. NPDC017520 TaxID=3364998 RepID=UPI0037BC10B7
MGKRSVLLLACLGVLGCHTALASLMFLWFLPVFADGIGRASGGSGTSELIAGGSFLFGAVVAGANTATAFRVFRAARAGRNVARLLLALGGIQVAATAAALFVGLTPLLLTALPALLLLALCYSVEQRASRARRHGPRPPQKAPARSTH